MSSVQHLERANQEELAANHRTPNDGREAGWGDHDMIRPNQTNPAEVEEVHQHYIESMNQQVVLCFVLAPYGYCTHCALYGRTAKNRKSGYCAHMCTIIPPRGRK